MIDAHLIPILSKNITQMMKNVTRKAALRDDSTEGGGGEGDAGDGSGGGGEGEAGAPDSSSTGKMVYELTNHVFLELTKAMINKSKHLQRERDGAEAGLSAASKSTVRGLSEDVCQNIHESVCAPSTQEKTRTLEDACIILNDLDVLIRAKKTSNALACVAQLRSKLL